MVSDSLSSDSPAQRSVRAVARKANSYVQPSTFDMLAGASPASGMAMIGLRSDNRLGEGRPSPGKLGRKRARTDRVEATKPEDVVGPEALANPGAAA